MKTIYRIICVTLLSYLSLNLFGDEKHKKSIDNSKLTPNDVIAVNGKTSLELVIQSGHGHFISYIEYSPDGKYIVSSAHNKTIKIWTNSGKLLKTILMEGNVDKLKISPDSKYILYTIYISSNKGGTKLCLIDFDGNKIGTTSIKSYQDIDFHPKENEFVVLSGNRIETWDFNTIKNDEENPRFISKVNRNAERILFIDNLTFLVLFNGKIDLLEWKTYKQLKRVNEEIKFMFYLKKTKNVIGITLKGKLYIWNLAGELIDEISMPIEHEILNCDYQENEEILALRDGDNLKIIDIKGHTLFSKEVELITKIKFSSINSSELVVASMAKFFILNIKSKVFSPEQSIPIFINTINYHTNVEKLRFEYKFSSLDGLPQKISNPYPYVFFQIGKSVINKIFSFIIQDKEILKNCPVKLNESESYDYYSKERIVRNKIINEIEGYCVYSISEKKEAYAPYGSRTEPNYFLEFEFLDSKKEKRNTLDLSNLEAEKIEMNVTEDGKFVVIKTAERIIITNGANTFYKQFSNSIIPVAGIDKIYFSDNYKYFFTISQDGVIRIFDFQKEKLIASIIVFGKNKCLIYTSGGYFDYQDKSTLDLISFTSPHIQSGFVDLQDLMKDYYYEGLLESLLEGTFIPNKKNNLTKGVETTSVVRALFETQQSVESKEESKSLQFQISERGSKFEKAVVYVNGIQVDEKTLVEGENTEGVMLDDDSKEGFFKYRVNFNLPLNFGTNRVEVKVYNAFKIPQSFPAFEIQRKIPENKELAKPDLYILSVGVNDYKTKKLTYSVPDAKAMAEAFQQGKTGIYREVHTKLLVDAKKKEIEDAFLEIEKKSRPQDVVLVYFSGHGMNAFTREGKKLFYFVPQDFKWPDDPENENVARNQGIDADYLDETFTKIKSHKLILILDACHSGSVNTVLASRGQDKEKATRKAMEKMANGTGRFIFASSSGNEESREHKDVGHGLYTYVLLNALGKNKEIADADSINKDGIIYLSEIRSYIEQQFEEQTAKYLKGVIQTPPSMSLGRNGMHERVNDFPLVKSGK